MQLLRNVTAVGHRGLVAVAERSKYAMPQIWMVSYLKCNLSDKLELQ